MHRIMVISCINGMVIRHKDGKNSLLKKCKWKGIEIPCSSIFKKFPTDQGLCCSFNMKAADEIFYAGVNFTNNL